MRRSKQTAAEPEPAAARPSNVSPTAPAPRPVPTPVAAVEHEPATAMPAAMSTALSTAMPGAMSAELTGDDLERGRTTALIATLGRVQLTLDLIERRMGRLEDSVAEIRDALTDEGEVGFVPAELAYVDAPMGADGDDPALPDGEGDADGEDGEGDEDEVPDADGVDGASEL